MKNKRLEIKIGLAFADLQDFIKELKNELEAIEDDVDESKELRELKTENYDLAQEIDELNDEITRLENLKK